MKAEDFLKRVYDVKEPLIEGLLYQRDLIAFGGRRRNGKTSVAFNLAVALASGKPSFLGHIIPKACKVQGVFLEDDPGELQKKYGKLFANERLEGRFDIIPRDLIPRSTTAARIDDEGFRAFITESVLRFNPDLLIIDNLTFLVGGNYNEAPPMQKVQEYVYSLAEATNCAVLIPAHLKKRSEYTTILREDPDKWFEEIMGSSHFINSFGSLWGIEKRPRKNEDQADFCGGTQRLNGEYVLCTTEYNKDTGWFNIVNDELNNLDVALRDNPLRRKVWRALPKDTPIAYADLRRIAVEEGMAATTFDYFFSKSLANSNLAVKIEDKVWIVKDVKAIGR